MRGESRVEQKPLDPLSVVFAPLYTDYKSDDIGKIYSRETDKSSDLTAIDVALNRTDFANHAYVITYVSSSSLLSPFLFERLGVI